MPNFMYPISLFICIIISGQCFDMDQHNGLGFAFMAISIAICFWIFFCVSEGKDFNGNKKG